ncbi:endonuclease VII domain-containing protein [Streptomyces stelliscabiei]|uniref:Endonuclease VII n=1 Tax=Streptomyces stelliscabiei TaxID=146820 RepID=A0A8I0P0C5_9ACTN|nr:endonuclease VII domain-containing protein [Streptomyces stelliscabiei]MBE1597221.1 hypothetical protein [Streptomyces stelliscabiei]
MTTKQCTRCSEVKRLSDFYSKVNRRPHRKADRTYASECKTCTLTYAAEWRARNADHADVRPLPASAFCGRCKTEKPTGDFALNRTKARGIQHMCLDCMRDRKYGLALGEYDRMLEQQGGGCAICKQPCARERRLSVDHCHSTGRVRGLLCQNCNAAIGMLKEDVALFFRAVNYLSGGGS